MSLAPRWSCGTGKELELLTGGKGGGGGGGAESLTAEALGTFRERIEKFLRWCFWSIMTIHFTVPSPVRRGQRQCFLLVTIPPRAEERVHVGVESKILVLW